MSLAKDKPTRDALRFLAFVFGVIGAGVGLAILGPPALNWLDVQIGLQSTPPPRPSSLPQAAQPIAVYGDGGGKVTEWKWAVCEERETPRYACRVYGERDRLEIVGEYWAHAGTVRRRKGRLPNPGETLQLSYLQDPATLYLTSPAGGKLLARGVLLFPVSRTKATVVDADGRLSDETPMSAAERESVDVQRK